MYSNLMLMKSIAGMYVETNTMHTPPRKVLRVRLLLSFFLFSQAIFSPVVALDMMNG